MRNREHNHPLGLMSLKKNFFWPILRGGFQSGGGKKCKEDRTGPEHSGWKHEVSLHFLPLELPSISIGQKKHDAKPPYFLPLRFWSVSFSSCSKTG
jgi:hypothetical protein